MAETNQFDLMVLPASALLSRRLSKKTWASSRSRDRAGGIWDLDAMGLRSNAYDGFCAVGAAARREPELSMENEGGPTR